MLGSFSTDVQYSKDNLLKVINNIPFKYFDIIKDKNQIEYKIIFSFPLVGEVVNEIYSDIININPSIYTNLTNYELDGGARGKFFEKIVTYHLNKDNLKNKEKEYIDYFQDYLIKYHDEMEVLVLNANEDPEKIMFEKKLEEGIYLVTQKRYNGKALDIALINVSKINEIIGIQISIHKKYIFKKKDIVDFLLNLKKNAEKYYDLKVEKENLYFCYIFDWKNKDKKMLNKCNKKGLKYFFFDVINDCFKDGKGNNIINLKKNLLNLSTINKEINKTSYFKLDNFFPKVSGKKEMENEVSKPDNQDIISSQKNLIKFNDRQEHSIKMFFQKALKLNFEPVIKYKFSMDYFNSKFVQDNTEFCISKYVGNSKDDEKSIIMFTNSSINKVIKVNGATYTYTGKYSNCFDYYFVHFGDKENSINNK